MHPFNLYFTRKCYESDMAKHSARWEISTHTHAQSKHSASRFIFIQTSNEFIQTSTVRINPNESTEFDIHDFWLLGFCVFMWWKKWSKRYVFEEEEPTKPVISQFSTFNVPRINGISRTINERTRNLIIILRMMLKVN